MNVVDPLVQSHPTNNPYLTGLRLIYERLRWDLNYRSANSRKALKRLRNKYHNNKAVILCNGPSLLKTDFEELMKSGVFTFGLNKVNLLFDKTDFRPNVVVAVNDLVVEQNLEFFNKTEIPLFITSRAVTKVKSKSVIFLKSTQNRKFAKDCSMSLYEGATVTFVAMQLAFHLGFSEIALIGCDHNFATKGPANATVKSEDSDPNHFDPNYFAGGVKWDLPDLFESEVSYTMAKNMYEAYNRKIYNCTEGGKLQIFDRMDLTDFLKS